VSLAPLLPLALYPDRSVDGAWLVSRTVHVDPAAVKTVIDGTPRKAPVGFDSTARPSPDGPPLAYVDLGGHEEEGVLVVVGPAADVVAKIDAARRAALGSVLSDVEYMLSCRFPRNP
jgi:hypothetical protein